MTLRIYLALVAVLLALACGQLGSSGPPPPTKIGVFADTGEVTELTAYAEQVGMASYGTLKVKEDIPVAASVRCFYVNMPDSKITDSKVFLLQQLVATFDEENAQALKADIEKVGEGTYKLTAPDLSGKKGIAALKVGMPLGTKDRLYLLRLQ